MAGSIFFTVEVKTLAGLGDDDPSAWSECERYQVMTTARNRAIILADDRGYKTRVCRVHVLELDLSVDPHNVKGVGIA